MRFLIRARQHGWLLPGAPGQVPARAALRPATNAAQLQPDIVMVHRRIDGVVHLCFVLHWRGAGLMQVKAGTERAV